ncbi:MAG: crossover junction endodeoxyribonuclease RuvC [Simkania sp.]|nr:crossover junction endodeoxyribonuclease RuvC [Simkania sp.]
MIAEKKKTYTILGIDPGTRITGYGIVKTDLTFYEPLDYGAIRPPPKLPLFERQLIIHEAVAHLLELHPIDAISIESQYVNKNPQSALKLGMAKGVAILAGTQRKIPVFEYAPKKAKIAVVGTGNATKEQVGRMIQVLLHLPEVPHPEDAADALALALCHSHHIKGFNYA